MRFKLPIVFAPLGFDLRRHTEAALTTLTSDVVTSSAIEGVTLNPENVRSSIARRLGIDVGGYSPASRDVEGIVEIMLDATQKFTEPLTAETPQRVGTVLSELKALPQQIHGQRRLNRIASPHPRAVHTLPMASTMATPKTRPMADCPPAMAPPAAADSVMDAPETAHATRPMTAPETMAPITMISTRSPVNSHPALSAPPPAPPGVSPSGLRPPARSSTFEECWRTYWQVKERQLSNGKHRDQWQSTLKTYVLRPIGKRPIADIRPSEIIDLLKPIWTTKEETARRVLQRIDAIFVSAITREIRDKASPCTGVARELGLRRHDQRHHAALPYADVAAFIRQLRERNGRPATRLAFEFLILTATRSGEARGALWSEINLADRLWTISADRMKGRVEHVVPLSDSCLSILETARAAYPNSTLCFPSRTATPLSDMVFTKLLCDMGLSERATAHGFRTSFKIWAAETGTRDEVSEAALAHADQNRVRAAYRRTTYLEERCKVMDKWAEVVRPRQLEQLPISRVEQLQV